jgi:hypothetical protein
MSFFPRVFPRSGIGGGGGPPPWTPASLTNLRGWYRADLGVTLVGSDVDAWADQSGVGNHLEAASSGARPLFGATSGPNSTPAITFDGSAEWLRKLSFSAGGTVGAHTFAMVVRLDAFTASRRWASYGGAALVLNSTGTPAKVRGARAGGADSISTTTMDTTYRSVLYTWDGSSQSVWIGSTAEDTDANAGSAIADSGSFEVASSVGSNFGAITLAELAFMRAAMTSGERAGWAAYVSARYGV